MKAVVESVEWEGEVLILRLDQPKWRHFGWCPCLHVGRDRSELGGEDLIEIFPADHAGDVLTRRRDQLIQVRGEGTLSFRRTLEELGLEIDWPEGIE
jgi:hypothetical protein